MSRKLFAKFEIVSLTILPIAVCAINLLLLNAVAFGSANVKAGAMKRYVSGIGIDANKLALQGVVVVKFKSGTAASTQELLKVPELQKKVVTEANPTSVNSVIRRLNMKVDKASQILNDVYLVHYSGTVTPALMAQSLITNPDVQYAEPHYMYKEEDVTPNDDSLSEQYALTKIDAFRAWSITQGSSSVAIGIVDDGVDWMHPDLYGNIWHNPHWQTDIDYPDDSIGWDFGGHNAAGTPNNNPEEDIPAHGTHVAGIAAAVSNNGIGIAGVAQCKIMAVKTSQAGEVDDESEPYIIYGFEGIIYAANNGARVINCSWGGAGYSQYEQDIINYATAEGALVVAAAGNDDHSTEFESPAYYDNVLSVAATDQNDKATYFTSVSYNVSVSAPGLDIISTWGTDTYAYLNGTSMASPCAAGVAALVVSQHPEYTPQQVLEQVRVSSDNVDANNTSLVHELGFGRVDAYRALTVSSPGVRIDSLTLADSTGNGNGGVFPPGDTVHVLGNVTDWLSPTSNLQLTLTSGDPNVTVIKGNFTAGALQTKGIYKLGENDLIFKVNNNVPYGYEATLLITMTDGSYSDYQGFTVTLNTQYGRLALNNLETTITPKGNIGYNDYPNNTQGIGFLYQPDILETSPEETLLYEGAYMAGVSSSRVVDAARDSTTGDSAADKEDNDFRPLGAMYVETSSDGTEQETVSSFSDSNATTNRLGIQVTLDTYAYNRDSTQNFIILEYRIHNLTSTPLSNFYGGIFLDWDISPLEDIASFDKNYQLGYAYDSTRAIKTYTGCALIYGANINYAAIDNANTVSGIYNGFSKLQKWNALSGGTAHSQAGPSDISMVVSGGPVTVPAGGDTVLTFALVAGDALGDLERAVNVAREFYGVPTNVVPPPAIPRIAELYQNYPNPFNPTTIISFDLSEQAEVTMEVFNVIGQRVKTMTDQNYSAGSYKLSLSASDLASGVYFVRLRAVSRSQSYVQSRKVMVLK
ncbi:MAG: S8 family serine peptidase [Candidatus Kryptoniota bacterium]